MEAQVPGQGGLSEALFCPGSSEEGSDLNAKMR